MTSFVPPFADVTIDPSPEGWPALARGLEEVCAAAMRDMAAAFVFSLGRLADTDRRPVALVATRAWRGEQGLPHGPGLSGASVGRDLLLVLGRTEAEALWAMEQGLRSGSLAAVIGTVEGANLAQTRRLEFAARDGEAVCTLLRQTSGGLNAARRRWRISAAPSAPDPDDERAPGRFRLRAELTRSRMERPGVWKLEQDDETHRLRLADRLAGDGLVEKRRIEGGRATVAA